MNQSVLIIDDDDAICELIENAVLLNQGKATILDDSEQLSSVNLSAYALIFLDLNMPGKDGIEIINELSQKQFKGAICLISGFDDWMLSNARHLAEAKGLRVLSQLTKPFRLDEIEGVLIKSIEDNQLAEEATQSNSPLEESLSYADIVAAIKGKRIKVFYQPQVDMATHTFIGVEALIRIETDEGGLITPNLFLKVAEQEHLIHELTKVIIKTAFRDYQKHIHPYGSIVLSMNLSAEDIEDLGFPNWLSEQAKAYDIEPAHVVLELNSLDKIQSSEKALEVLMRLRLKGFKISLDEFGKDHSVLDQIKRFPLTELKIHPSFIQDIEDSSKTQLILKSTAHLCREVGLDIVINGVENQAVETLLTNMGLLIGQGYFYSKPLPLSGLLELLKNHSKQVAEASIAYLESGQEGEEVEVDLSAGYKSEQVTQKRQNRYLGYAKEDDRHLLLTPLPLTGQLAYIGNSQLLGFELALIEFRKKHPSVRIELGAYDDESDFEKHLDFYDEHVPKRTLAILGGAFPYQQTERYLKRTRKVKRPIVAPFNGCSRLRSEEHANLFNFKPSFKDEIDYLVERYLASSKAVLVLKPKEHLVDEYSHLEGLFPDWHYEFYHQYKVQKLVQFIHKNKIKQVLFIGSAKFLMELMEAVDNPEVEFYAASLTGFALISRILKRTARINLTLTDPIPDYQEAYPLATRFNKLVNRLDKDQKRYVNAVSFEAYLIMSVLLELIAEKQIDSKQQLDRCLRDLIGHEIGLDDRLTFSPHTRTLMHKIYEHRI